MITTISESGKTKYGIKEFIVDSVDDLTAIPDCSAGSMALILSSGQLYIKNQSNGWTEFNFTTE